jgi:hypothetical protein
VAPNITRESPPRYDVQLVADFDRGFRHSVTSVLAAAETSTCGYNIRIARRMPVKKALLRLQTAVQVLSSTY